MPANTMGRTQPILHDDLCALILRAVALGAKRAHIRYLPEVLALHCQGKLRFIEADQHSITLEKL